MELRGKRWAARVAVVAVAGAASLTAAGGAAVADPPPGWVGGDQYETAAIAWKHQAKYLDAPGNWHSGYVYVSESGPGISGQLYDWRCPAGVTPPNHNAWPPVTTVCTVKRTLWFNTESLRDPIHPFDMATFNHKKNLAEVHHDVLVEDGNGSPAGTIRIDVTFKGVGAPDVTKDESGPGLVYSEYWHDTKTVGRVNGHRVNGPGVTQYEEAVGFTLDGWVRP